jgi:hypothetical protein
MQTAEMTTPLLIAALICTVVAAIALTLHRRAQRRHLALTHLLDRADAMEDLLLRTRERMRAMRTVVDQVPEDIAEVAQASLHAERPIQDALRDVLEHRLWIQRHGQSASYRELSAACSAIDRAHQTLSQQLQALEHAGAELSAATAAAAESARREPPALRRSRSDS